MSVVIMMVIVLMMVNGSGGILGFHNHDVTKIQN